MCMKNSLHVHSLNLIKYELKMNKIKKKIQYLSTGFIVFDFKMKPFSLCFK